MSNSSTKKPTRGQPDKKSTGTNKKPAGDKSMQRYRSPLEERYASAEMLALFSPQWKYGMWRRLWLILAETQQKLGLPISNKALGEMRRNLDNLKWRKVKAYEKRFRHDVMAHIHAFGDVAPAARGIIHLGATSAYVVDNTDIIEMREALILTQTKVIAIMRALAQQADKYKKAPTLGYTHFQPAQPTTIGRRLTLYLQELLLDLEDLNYTITSLPLRSIKGATGTQASFLTLFRGSRSKVSKADHDNVLKLEKRIAEKFGFKNILTITGQTSTRKLDYRVATCLSGLAQTASKFAMDIRLSQHQGEMAEPFGKDQVGSSAMPFKRNPMQAERIGSLARFVMALPATFAYTASTQWFERTLDDSANRRLSMPEAFLATDGILELMRNIATGLRVDTGRAAENLKMELPFMSLENLMMRSVNKRGGNRQKLHEETRSLSMDFHESRRRGEWSESKNPLMEVEAKLKRMYRVSPKTMEDATSLENFTGRSVQQVDKFLGEMNRKIKKIEKECAKISPIDGMRTHKLGDPDVRV